jgi:hypothetical protein
MNFLDKLNPQQRQVVMAKVGPVLVQAALRFRRVDGASIDWDRRSVSRNHSFPGMIICLPWSCPPTSGSGAS